jgi:hypothetical protein
MRDLPLPASGGGAVMDKITVKIAIEALTKYKKKFAVDGKLFDLGLCKNTTAENASKKLTLICNAIADLEKYLQENYG